MTKNMNITYLNQDELIEVNGGDSAWDSWRNGTAYKIGYGIGTVLAFGAVTVRNTLDEVFN
ncbi:hypothetical protein [Eudoraea sp.]